MHTSGKTAAKAPLGCASRDAAGHPSWLPLHRPLPSAFRANDAAPRPTDPLPTHRRQTHGHALHTTQEGHHLGIAIQAHHRHILQGQAEQKGSSMPGLTCGRTATQGGTVG